MEVGEGVPPLSVSAGLTQVVVRGEAPQRRKLPLPSYFLLAVLNRYHPNTTTYAKIILPICHRD